jgi:hypothetical protein
MRNLKLTTRNRSCGVWLGCGEWWLVHDAPEKDEIIRVRTSSLMF